MTQLADWSKVLASLDEAAHPYQPEQWSSGECIFPGAVLLVGVGGEVVFKKAAGCRSLRPTMTQMKEEVVFDVSSLTKAIVTSTLVMKLVEQDVLTLDTKLTRIYQHFGTLGKGAMTIKDLLAHTSGFPAYVPFYETIAKADAGGRVGILQTPSAVEMILAEIFETTLNHPPGTSSCYSDLGFILLGHVVETLYGGTSLEILAQKEIFGPLEMKSSGYVNLYKLKQHKLEAETEMIAPTNECKWRKRILCGEVQDENAWAMGGVAGHAGVFSTVDDVHRFAVKMISCWKGESDFVDPDVVRHFWTRDETIPGSTWALGWDTPTAGSSSSGSYFPEHAVGHLGFTGCSVWIDPERELDVVLLSNRVHPSVENKSIKQFRPKIHDLVVEALGFEN